MTAEPSGTDARQRLAAASHVRLLALALTAALVPVAAMLGVVGLTVSNEGDVLFAVLMCSAILPYAATGFFVAWRRPSNPIGWLVLVLPSSFGVSTLLSEYSLFAARTQTDLSALSLWLSYWLWVPGWLALGLVFLLFPDGRLPSPRWRSVVVAISLVTAIAAVVAAFNNDPRGTLTGRPNPLALAVPFSLYNALIPLLIVVFVIPAISLVARYRRADGTVRRQLKWLAYGATVLATLALAYLPLAPDPAAPSDAADVAFLVAIAAPAVAIGIAILRERVYDIDLLIHRTLVYGVVSAVLVATYVAAVILTGTALRIFTAGSDLAVAASTLLVVALFQPIRTQVQGVIDRRFYRSRYDAARTLDAFSARLRNDVELESVRVDLIGVVAETVRPAHASLWLR